eukprot:gb/GECG01010777.1/.p1 GENE.gb/GECG01010777.1/~~gb/GECG01010777.1/.p1  ORF type:complete len:214 (+),score=17.81 gb/GECG01010777.1/:1-642(+)
MARLGVLREIPQHKFGFRRRFILSRVSLCTTVGAPQPSHGNSAGPPLRTALTVKELEQTTPRFRPFVYSPDGIALGLEVYANSERNTVECLAYAGKTTLGEVVEELQGKLRDALRLEKTPTIDVRVDGEHVQTEHAYQEALSAFAGRRVSFTVKLDRGFQGEDNLTFAMNSDQKLYFPTSSAKRTLYMGYAYVAGGSVAAAAGISWLARFLFT